VLTRQGWLCVWGGVTLLVLARLLGIGELDVFAAVVLGLVVIATLYVRLTRLDLQVDRVVHPARVHVGQASRVQIRVRNLRTPVTPVLRLVDPVSGTAGAELLVPPLDHGERSAASYRLPTDRRGIVHVGPLRVVVGDPFGLAQTGTRAAPEVEVTVFPATEDIRPVPVTTGNDPLAGVLHPHALGRTGDDFYALRPYVVGDDLRRIHWPSTARHDELLVRQQEQPWQARTTVLLDVRRAAYDPASFEAAVSAAASVVTVTGAQRDLVRLVTSDGADSGFGTGSAHTLALLEHLAVCQWTGSASLRAMMDLLRNDGQGALIVVLGRATGDDLAAAARLRTRYGLVRVVQVDLSADGGPQAAAVPEGAVVRVGPGMPFATAWNRAIAAASAGRPVARSAR
jgi:uncharacterized protein (DUF58 family)